MAKKKAPDTADGPAPKKGRSNMIPAVVVAAGLLGGGYFMSGGGGAKAEPAGAAVAGASATTSTTEGVNGEVVKLDPITMNLADGRFVKLGLGLQLKEGVPAEGFETKAAKALDLAISTFGDVTAPALAAPGGREATKDALNKKIAAAYGGKITDIYFTEFVVQ